MKVNDKATKYTDDVSGFQTYKDQKLTKAGVYQYLGSEIRSDLEPNKAYNVLRPADEIKKSLRSFENIPWTINHEMMGPKYDGKNEIHGVVSQVYFDESDQWMKGTIKVFTKEAIKLIESGLIDELSLGYNSTFKEQSGAYEGKNYDFEMTELNGNHLALVEKSRTDIKVMDTIYDNFPVEKNMSTKDDDAKEEKESTQEKMEKSDKTLDVAKALDEIMNKIKDLETKMESNAEEEETKKEAEKKDAMDQSQKQSKDLEEKVLASTKEYVKETLDSWHKESLSRTKNRDKLAHDLSKHVGDFDYSDMTIEDVANYGIKKLNITSVNDSVSAIKAVMSVLDKDSTVDTTDNTQEVTNNISEIFGVK